MTIYCLSFYKILYHRYKNKMGEIDIIARKNNTIIFIEVKFRRNDIDDILCSNYQKQRITAAAKVFLQSKPQYQSYDVRFDCCILKPFRLPYIIKNAW